MKPGWILGIGALFCAAVTVLSRIWLPYSDLGVSDNMKSHVAATTALIVSIALFFGYLALKKSEYEYSEQYGSLVTAYFLGIFVLITLSFFVGTYFNLSYSLFWTAQVFLYCVLFVIWIISTKAVAPMTAEREGKSKISGLRKQNITDGLYKASIAFTTIDTNAAKKLQKEIDKLQNEVKFFPNHATGADAESIFAELNRLVQSLAELAGSTESDEESIKAIEQMTVKVNAAQRHVAQWKRV